VHALAYNIGANGPWIEHDEVAFHEPPAMCFGAATVVQ
jgi:hypothetical protein